MQKQLNSQGWYLKEEFVGKFSELKDAIASALHLDFRDIGGSALPPKRDDTIPGRIVLQVTKVRNISAPKSNEDSKAAPRFLQLELTDGTGILYALDMDSLPALSLTTLPGTKIFFRAEHLQLTHGFLILRAADMEVLGGRVEALVEKWEFARSMLLFARSGRRSSTAGGPPPWVAFGKKLDALVEALPNDKNFKSLQTNVEKIGKPNDEFNNMRSEAIAEATKVGAKKTFGGGGQHILDHNMKKILEKGYDAEAAKEALQVTNNNLERALYNLKRRQDDGSMPVRNSRGPREGNGRRGGGFHQSREDDAALAARPAGNVSLFDFLTDKLPVNTEAAPTALVAPPPTTTATYTNPFSREAGKGRGAAVEKSNYRSNGSTQDNAHARSKFQNNISSSFNANTNSHESLPPRKNFSERGAETHSRGKGGAPNETAKAAQHEDTKKRPLAAQHAPAEFHQNHKGRSSGSQRNVDAVPNDGNQARAGNQSKSNGYDKKNRSGTASNRNNNGAAAADVTTTVAKSDIEALVEAAAKLKLEKQKTEKLQQQQRQKSQHSHPSTFGQQQPQQQQKAQYPPDGAYQNRGHQRPAMGPLPSAQQYPMAAAVAAPVISNAWPWRIGDLCMAKYWDDGRYYDARITAVSENTCVVFFMNYGNHEEVVKSDILPITDATYQPISVATAIDSNAVQNPAASFMPGDFVQHHRGGGGISNNNNSNNAAAQQQRREQRSMYVPPHKRYN